MHLEIITPDKKVFEGDVISAKFPGTSGAFEVLNSHAALISTLDNGPVRIATTAGPQTFYIDGGVVEVLNNKIVVLAEAILS